MTTQGKINRDKMLAKTRIAKKKARLAKKRKDRNSWQRSK